MINYFSAEEAVVLLADQLLCCPALIKHELLTCISTGHWLRFHDFVGCHIRNHFGMWDQQHPNCRKWHDAGGYNDSPDHPDQYSLRILQLAGAMIESQLREELCSVQIV